MHANIVGEGLAPADSSIPLPILSLEGLADQDPQLLLAKEWLVTNGLGGYASGTVAGVSSRRYHGYLISALAAPYGRTMTLHHLGEEFHLPGSRACWLDGRAGADGRAENDGLRWLQSFRLEAGLPVWTYRLDGCPIERRLVMPHRENTVCIQYRLLCDRQSAELRVRPWVDFRAHHDVVTPQLPTYHLAWPRDGVEIRSTGYPPLRMCLHGTEGEFVCDGGQYRDIFYPLEAARGYDHNGRIWCPGEFRVQLPPRGHVTLVASTEAWDSLVDCPAGDETFAEEHRRRRRLIRQAAPLVAAGPADQLVLAADQFVIAPAARPAEITHARVIGEDVPAIIAGYHWFTDWGRDTMISLEGLLLLTGRVEEARDVLRTYAHYVCDGLIPNFFPEGSGRGQSHFRGECEDDNNGQDSVAAKIGTVPGEGQGLYHTADATLWYFHALDRYLAHTGDRATLKQLLPVLANIVEHHQRGTRFGIHVDPRDGLLAQGAEGYQLTWMDAKVGDWVVTPRRGKAVEINALWYNALRLMAQWTADESGPEAAGGYAEAAARARQSFNQRFWYEAGGYLYDVVDGPAGDDPAMRPNQLLAISLPRPVLDECRWATVVQKVVDRLLTPVGLRSLAPGEPGYCGRYVGDLVSRDAAYHQGTVWAWLIGPMVDAWLRVYPDRREEARGFLAGFWPHLAEAGLGTISEVFDAEAPFTPRAGIAQAWSIAEVLRCWAKVQ